MLPSSQSFLSPHLTHQPHFPPLTPPPPPCAPRSPPHLSPSSSPVNSPPSPSHSTPTCPLLPLYVPPSSFLPVCPPFTFPPVCLPSPDPTAIHTSSSPPSAALLFPHCLLLAFFWHHSPSFSCSGPSPSGSAPPTPLLAQGSVLEPIPFSASVCAQALPVYMVPQFCKPLLYQQLPSAECRLCFYKLYAHSPKALNMSSCASHNLK